MICRVVLLLLLLWPAGLAADNLSPDFNRDHLVLFDRDALLAGWITRDSPHATKLMAGAGRPERFFTTRRQGITGAARQRL